MTYRSQWPAGAALVWVCAGLAACGGGQRADNAAVPANSVQAAALTAARTGEPAIRVSPVPATAAAPTVVAAAPNPALHGAVSGIQPIEQRPAGTGAGAVVGGVLGAVVGHQFGQGNGKTALTLAGAAGGAIAGNNVERNVKKQVVGYRVSVRLDNGASRTFEQARLDGLQVGDRVRVDGPRLRRG